MLGGEPAYAVHATLFREVQRNNCPTEPKTYNSKGQRSTCTNVCTSKSGHPFSQFEVTFAPNQFLKGSQPPASRGTASPEDWISLIPGWSVISPISVSSIPENVRGTFAATLLATQKSNS